MLTLRDYWFVTRIAFGHAYASAPIPSVLETSGQVYESHYMQTTGGLKITCGLNTTKGQPSESSKKGADHKGQPSLCAYFGPRLHRLGKTGGLVGLMGGKSSHGGPIEIERVDRLDLHPIGID